jgi:hypothetical protein
MHEAAREYLLGCRCAYAEPLRPGGVPVLVPSDDCDLHWPLAVEADDDRERVEPGRAELGDG